MKIGKSQDKLILSDRRPFIPATADVGISTIIRAISEFGDKYLDGIAVIRTPKEAVAGTVHITFEQLAYAIKLAVKHFISDEPLDIDLRVMDDELHVSLFLPREPELNEAAEICEAFRKAGFSIVGYGLSLSFSAPIKVKKNLSLRQPNEKMYVMLMEKIFFN